MGRRDCLRVIEQQALQRAGTGTGDRKPTLTAFPFSSQVTVGTGAPAAVHRSVTMEPKVMFWDSGAFRILAKTVGEDKGTVLNGCLQLRLVWCRGVSSQYISKQATTPQRKLSKVLRNNSLMRGTKRRNKVGSVVVFHTLQTKILALEIYTQPLFTGSNVQKPPRWLAVNRRHITIWKHRGTRHGGRGWGSGRLISVTAAIRTHHRAPQAPLFSMPWHAWVVSFYHLTMGARPAKALGNWDCTGQEGHFSPPLLLPWQSGYWTVWSQGLPLSKRIALLFWWKEHLTNFLLSRCFNPETWTWQASTSCISAAAFGRHRGKQRRESFPMWNIWVLTQKFQWRCPNVCTEAGWITLCHFLL